MPSTPARVAAATGVMVPGGKRVAVTLTDEQFTKIKFLALENRVSLSDQIRSLVSQCLKSQQ